MKKCYYKDIQVEILFLTKPNITHDLVFIMLTTEEAWDKLHTSGLTFNFDKLMANIIKKTKFGSPSKLWMNTTLVANNLPLREITSTIAKTINIIFGEDNISNINFGYNAIWMETKICAMFSILMRRCIQSCFINQLTSSFPTREVWTIWNPTKPQFGLHKYLQKMPSSKNFNQCTNNSHPHH